MFKLEIKNIKKNKQHFIERGKIMFKLKKKFGAGAQMWHTFYHSTCTYRNSKTYQMHK